MKCNKTRFNNPKMDKILFKKLNKDPWTIYTRIQQNFYRENVNFIIIINLYFLIFKNILNKIFYSQK